MHLLQIDSTSPADQDGAVSATISCACRRWSTTVEAPDGAACFDAMIAQHAAHADAALAESARIMAAATGSVGCTYIEEHVDWSTGQRVVLSTRSVTV